MVTLLLFVAGANPEGFPGTVVSLCLDRAPILFKAVNVVAAIVSPAFKWVAIRR
jgi:hypothetical protein